jgi:hypothetical protein
MDFDHDGLYFRTPKKETTCGPKRDAANARFFLLVLEIAVLSATF